MALAQAPVLDDFVLFGANGLRARGLDVESGDVGTNGTLIGSRRIEAPDSRIVGDRVELDKASVCDELLARSGKASGGCGPAQPVAIPVVANLASACGFPNPFPTQCSGQSIFVGHDGFAERGPGTYGTVDVAGGGQGPGTLVLSAGTYTFCSLRLGRNASLLASGPVTINVIQSFKLDNGSQLRPQSGAIGPCDIQIFAGTNGKVRISRKAHVQGILCAPNARLDVTVGANLRGAFYAREVKTDRAFLDLEECAAPPTTTSTTAAPGSTSTSTTSSSTTSTTSTCGNGVIDAGEQCDGSAAGGLCLPQECLGCLCPGIPTTSTSQAPTSSTTSTSTTSSSTTTINCGNDVIDPGEDCDGSAAGGLCLPEECVACSCPTVSTTSTSLEPTTSSSSSSTVTTSSSSSSTTINCGNDVIDPGEDCDGSAAGGLCLPEECVGCSCPTVSTTSSSAVPTTSTSSTSTSTSNSSSTTTSTTSSSTTLLATTSTTSSSSSSSSTAVPTTVAPTTTSSSSSTSSSTSTTSSSTPPSTTVQVPTAFDFLATAGTGVCGNTFRDLAGTVPLKKLLCGSLSLGGGISQVLDNATPPGATNRFALSCTGSDCTVSGTAPGSTPAGIECTAVGCRFGTPLPISNQGLSVCVTNTFYAPTFCTGAGAPFACCTGAGTGTCAGPTGTLNTATGAANLDFKLNSATVLTGNPAQPCPICAQAVGGAACVGSVASPCTGVCDGSPNQGAVCTTKNPNGLTNECPSPAAVAGAGGQRCFRGTNNGAVCTTGADCPGGLCAQFIGNIPISLAPLTTGTASLASADGLFCPGQTATQRGAFNSAICNGGANTGKPCTAATATADCGAGITCRPGTLTNICNGGANDGLGCSNNTGCTGGTCVKAGTLVQLVREIGVPAGALSIGVAKPITLGSAFCVVATTNPTVNTNANLPGPGATSIIGTVTLVP